MYTLHQDREVMYTKRLLRTARRLRVRIPDKYDDKGELTDYWERAWDGPLYLSESGDAQLRSAIRVERKERHEARAHWINWIAAITGLVGAVTGLLAIILAG
jgi:hypothetical protein